MQTKLTSVEARMLLYMGQLLEPAIAVGAFVGLFWKKYTL